MTEEILGDYKILKTLGHGSLGATMLAEHRFIKKPYVLKILPRELSSDRAFISRFEEEVNLLGALDHPHIVKIHNVSYAGGVYFLVSDCVVDSLGETTNLAQYMSGRERRLREDELYHLAVQVASALDYAHSKNGDNDPIIHRCLKLSNVLVGKGKPGIEVALSDFGLAKIIGSAAVVSRSFKAAADSLGHIPKEGEGEKHPYLSVPIEATKVSKLTLSFLQNYAFLAPEQKRAGNLEKIETDSYAFGVLVYFLITGEFPEGFFPLPSEIAPEYQHRWDELVVQCLHKNIEKRPKQLMPLLEEIAQGEKQKAHFIQPPMREQKEVIKEKPQVLLTPTPVIQKQEEEVTQKIPVAVQAEIPEVVAPQPTEPKSVLLATPPAITPPKDEGYQQRLTQMLHREPIVTEYHPEQKEKKEITPLLSEMAVIPQGNYERGSNCGARDEMPRHGITIDGFAMDVHPVTNEQFVRLLECLGGEKDQQYNDVIRLKESRINRTGGKLSIESGYSKHPVVGVTWYGAIGYAKWVGKRLPSEAEWEIACGGGIDNQPFPTGETIEKNAANFFSSDTTAVRSYAPNGYGLYDMVGNVYEWCQDWYGYNYYETSAQEPTNPKGPIQGVYRVLRGGCWKSLKEDLRISHRHRNNPGTVNGTYGFRCAADVT